MMRKSGVSQMISDKGKFEASLHHLLAGFPFHFSKLGRNFINVKGILFIV